jgi:geranylgeranyl diphosphate synthase, type I
LTLYCPRWPRWSCCTRFALVHDDVMDDSAIRRGRPTTHRAFARAHEAEALRGDPHRYGEGAAILVGDLCLVWADQLIASSGLPGHRLVAARACYDRMRLEAIAGQFLDLLGGASPVWTVDRALLTIRLKTASYTAVRPLHYGAALAGGGLGGPVHRAYTRYGMAVGEAFQLRDDLLGLDGDPAVTGKPVGDDADGHKPTVLLQLARALATDTQAAELAHLLSPDEGVDPAVNRRRLADLVRQTGATERVEKLIDERVATALAVLEGPAIDPDAQAALADLARAAAWRTA